MKWWFIQSLSALLAAFALGIPIGYLIWRLQFRRIRLLDMKMGAGPDTATARPVVGQYSGSVSKMTMVDSGGVAVLESPTSPTTSAMPSMPSTPSTPSMVASGSGSASVAMLDRLRVEHAAELSRTRSALHDREVLIADLRSQLEASRKISAERDAGLTKLSPEISTTRNVVSKNDREAKLLALAEQRDAARAGLAKALADYETRLAALRSEHEQESKSLRSEHAAAVERLQSDAENRINEIRSERESVATALQKANGEFDQQRSALQARHESALSDLRKRAERAEAELSTVRSELEGQRVEVAKRTAAFEAERSTMQSELTTMRKTLSDAEGALDRAKADISEAIAARDSLQRDVAIVSNGVEQANADLANARSELQTAKTALEATRSVADRHRLDAEEARSELALLHATMEEVRANHLTLQARYDDLAERERSTRQSLSFRGGTDLVPEQQRPAKGAKSGGVRPVDVADDLERIEGIGPRISASLQAVGIRTFSQLSSTGEDRLRDALARAGLNLAPSLPTWPQQAAYLAVGDEKSFRELVERLVAGREAK